MANEPTKEPKIRESYSPSDKERKLLKMVYERHSKEQWEAHRPDRQQDAWQSNNRGGFLYNG